MTYKSSFFTTVFLAVCIGMFYAIQSYKSSGFYIDKTFSNRNADNKQFPTPLMGDCFGGTDLLSAKVIRETNSTLLLRINYCNNLTSDKAVLGMGVNEDSRVAFASTPGGTVNGYGTGFVRLIAQRLKEPTTVSNYTIQIYGNNSRRTVIRYPFYYEKVWCNDEDCTYWH